MLLSMMNKHSNELFATNGFYMLAYNELLYFL